MLPAPQYPTIERKAVPGGIVYSERWKGHNDLDVSDFKHFRINHAKPHLTWLSVSAP
jgi:transposase-like protein|tara:strand:- start:4016 stop:4186 length:171 start_codon:yes stop_codon:yes gene_type:complete